MDKCEWAERRRDKLYRCLNPARQTVNLEGETLNLCPIHASIVMQLIAKKERLQKNYEQVMNEITMSKQKILDAHQELVRREKEKAETISSP